MRHLFYGVIISLIFISSTSTAETYKQIRIPFPDRATLTEILESGIEPVYSRPGEYIDFALNERDLGIFNVLGLAYTVVHEDLSAFYQSRNPVGITMGGYRVFSEIVAVMDSFAANYPSLCSPKSSIATTEQGRQVWVMKISDNPGQNEDEPEALVTGLHHAREPIGSEINLEFMRFLLTGYGSDPIATNLVNNYEIYFCPVTNPDGYEYNRLTNPGGGGMWRKNRRNNGDGSYGIDLNRNYAQFWGYDNSGSSGTPSSDLYRGMGPASEPEIAGLQSFILAHDFAIVVNYHAYGPLFLYSWGYYNGYADDMAYFDTLGAYAGTLGYTVGTAWETLYNTNGDSNDWGYGEDRLKKKCMAVVIEVGTSGDGFWPVQSRIAPLVAENKNILKDLLPRALSTYKRRLPQMPNPVSPPMAAPGSQFYLRWTHPQSDTFNLPASYRVIEKSGFSRAAQTFEATAGYTLDGFTRNTTRRHNGTYSVYSGQTDDSRKYVTISERLKVQIGDSLIFWAWYNIESNYDYAYIQVSTDGGQVWYEINGNLSTTSNPNRHNKGYGITGSSGGAWVRGAYPLEAYAGQEIKTRFAYWTDANTLNEGIYFDDVSPIDNFTSSTVLAEAVVPESLLVGPYSIGTRWFQVEARDDLGHLSGPSNRFQVDILGDTYVLSGHAALSNSPADLSGTVVTIAGAGLADTTDISGDYLFPMVGQGTYDIMAAHPAYYPDTIFAFNLSSDSTLDFSLILAPPGAPMLSSPSNYAVFDTEYVAFDWNDVAGASNYIIEVAADINFANVLFRDSSLILSAYTNSLPFANSIYYWRVTARNTAGVSPRSAAWSFTVNVTLAAPSLISPANGFVSDSSYLNFEWSDVNRATGYIMAISRNSQFTDIAQFDSNLAASSFRNSAPLPNGAYYWRITAFNATLISPPSAARSLTVNVMLQAPILLVPSDGYVTDTALVSFDWNDVAGAISYTFEAATDSIFANRIVVDSGRTVSAFAGDFADGRYFWRITAFNGTIFSARSEARDFEVRHFLAIPELLTPSIGYMSEVERVDFDWTDVLGAHFYIFEVALDSAFVNSVLADSAHALSAFPQAGPFINGHYYWRVIASNGLIESGSSAIRDFTISIFPGIPAPLLVSPGDGYLSPGSTVTFDWTDVGGPVTYLFELALDSQFGSMYFIDSSLAVSIFTNPSPLPEGEYYWRIRASDGIHWSPYSDAWAVIIPAQPVYLPGDANASGTVNGIDVVYLVNYFKGGPAPFPYLGGDANGSCTVNGIDVVYLVNFFKGGPFPYRGDCLFGINLEPTSAE